MPRRTRVAYGLALPALALLAVALGGCVILGTPEKELRFETYQDAPQRGDAAFVPSSFIPDDARELRIRVVVDGPGSVVSYRSGTSPVDDGCQAGSFDDDPLLDAAWWPSDVPAEGLLCGDWRVFEEDGTTYAFSR